MAEDSGDNIGWTMYLRFFVCGKLTMAIPPSLQIWHVNASNTRWNKVKNWDKWFVQSCLLFVQQGKTLAFEHIGLEVKRLQRNNIKMNHQFVLYDYQFIKVIE